MSISALPNVSDKALRDFAYRVMMSDYNNIKIMYPGTSPLELQFFVDSLSSEQLTEIYGMFYRTGLVQ